MQWTILILKLIRCVLVGLSYYCTFTHIQRCDWVCIYLYFFKKGKRYNHVQEHVFHRSLETCTLMWDYPRFQYLLPVWSAEGPVFLVLVGPLCNFQSVLSFFTCVHEHNPLSKLQLRFCPMVAENSTRHTISY